MITPPNNGINSKDVAVRDENLERRLKQMTLDDLVRMATTERFKVRCRCDCTG